MGKLTWEWDSTRDNLIVIQKPRGKLTVDEIMEFFDTREAKMAFGEGALCVIAWRIREESYSGWEFDEPKGDSKEVWVLGDDSQCFCGRILHDQYCPECGTKLF